VTQDLAVKLQILFGAFSLDLEQKKKLIFWQITQSQIPDEKKRNYSMGLIQDFVIMLLQTYSSQ
jgi:hypothetical protein